MSSPARDSILIGLCDGELDPGRYRSSHLTNKVGGRPDWPPGVRGPCPRCGVCGAPLVHVVQVYCPLDASPYHRNLHLFACTGGGSCGGGGGWRVLRSQGLETPSRPAPPQEAAPAATDWCDAADDWGVEEAGDGWGAEEEVVEEEVEAAAPTAEAAPPDVSDRLQGLSLGQSQDDVSPLLRPFFISVMDESDLCADEDELRHAQQLLRDYESREGVEVGRLQSGGEAGGGEEQYEKTEARHGDAVFSRFRKQISLCPQQILRYCRGGEPLFISEPPPHLAAPVAPAVPACSSCGGARTFELQLMPALVSLLQRADGGPEADPELEFGTVLVYTCRSSCWTTGSGSALDEFCLVQADPDQQLFK